MREIKLRPAARHDLEVIAIHTLKEWGAKQRNIYLSEIKDCFCRIAENPDIGVAREEVRQGYRSLKAGHHVVFYQVSSKDIDVVRILHERMDVGKNL